MQEVKVKTAFSNEIKSSVCFPIDNDQSTVDDDRIPQFEMILNKNCS
jgi:hypothetical protein